MRPAVVALAVSSISCAAPAPVALGPTCPEASAALPASASATVSVPTPSRLAEVTVRLTPVLEPPRLHVEITFARAEGRVFRIADATTVRDAHAEDAAGPMAIELGTIGAATTFGLPRDASPPLRLAYDVIPPGDPGTKPLALVVDPNFTRASFETVVALPDALDDRELDVALHVSWAPGYATEAASSLGVGADRTARMRGKDLRHVTALIGELGHARFEAYEGHDEAAWIGFTRFDPRWVAAETATARSSIDQFFGGKSGPPFTVLFVSGKRPDEPFAVALRTASVLVDAHFDAPWAGSVRMRVAHEFGHRWMGGRLWIGARNRENEGFWWSEGVNRAVVREVLFSLGTLSVSELGDEANSLLATEALSPFRGRGNGALGAVPRDRDVVAIQTARGGLYATRLELLLRKKQRSLRDVLRALFARAETEHVTELPLDAVADAIGAALGDDEVRVFRDVIERGVDVPLPQAALGSCFSLVKNRWESFDLGFSEETSASGRRVTNVRPGSAAARAGLATGDVITASTYREGRPRVPVVLKLERAGTPRELRFDPAGPGKEGRIFARKAGIRDEACER